MGLPHARFGRLLVLQHDLEFEEVSEALDAVEMDAVRPTRNNVRCLRTRPARPYADVSASRKDSGAEVGERT